jgi:hypothetical protein
VTQAAASFTGQRCRKLTHLVQTITGTRLASLRTQLAYVFACSSKDLNGRCRQLACVARHDPTRQYLFVKDYCLRLLS